MTDASSGLVLRESSIFERSSKGRTGFTLPKVDIPLESPKENARKNATELPEVSELDVIRHFTRLSTWNYAIDLGTFPLGSCTMKYNPRINEEIAILAGMSEIHPEMPIELCQGALEVIYNLEKILCTITGLDACSTQPAAGAQGEFTGLSLIKAFHTKNGNPRKLVLIPDSAHGTNPASCSLTGYETVTLESSAQKGIVEIETVARAIEKHGRDIAAMMVTNPNTLGIFESNIVQIAELLHSIGAQLYMDGANMNAILGVAKPKDMGVDVMQFNLHKTFSTPHGGGGPGAGPVAVRSHLSEFLPNPRVVKKDNTFYVENLPHSIGKVKSYFGNFGVLVRALTYILHHGSDGLKRVSRAATLNANYIKHKLSKYYDIPYPTPSFHECVLSDKLQQQKNVKTLQISKALIDEGFHPPTMYFPLVVSGAILIEPTETESLAELDKLIEAFIRIAKRVNEGESFDQHPAKTIVKKVDEVRASRTPVLTFDDRT